MNMKSMRVLALAGLSAGVVALAPSLASAFTGTLVHCSPTAGVGVVVGLKPGLTCTDGLNKIQVKATVPSGNPIDNCTANPAAPWGAWSTGKFGSKITAAAVAQISKADITIKASTFGSCNFSGSPTSATASGAGKIQFWDAGGMNKIGGSKGAFYATVAGDLATQSALAVGIMTKGFGVGARIEVQVAINLAGPTQCGMTSCNGLILACNTGAICPPDPFGPTQPPITALDLITNATSYTEIAFADNALCTGAGTPWKCCTGAGTGTC